jgi:diketogulonate reductase-like aldo/keto reductase
MTIAACLWHWNGLFQGRWSNKLESASCGLKRKATEQGFYHLDCSEMCEAEEEVGGAIQDSGVPREKLFITNTVDQGINDIPPAIEKNLEKL